VHVEVLVFHQEVEQVSAQVVTPGEEGGREVAPGIHAAAGIGTVGIEKFAEAGKDRIVEQAAEDHKAAELEAG
jgi:hypothetical protein